MTRIRAIVATAIILPAVALLTGCGAQPSTEPTPSASAPAPSPSAAAVEATPPFTGTIDLDALAGPAWPDYYETTADDLAFQNQACDAFFGANLPSRAPLTPNSAGPEVAQDFMDRMLLLQSLAATTTDPRYLEAANNIATCVAANLIYNDGSDPALGWLRDQIYAVNKWSYEGATINFIEPDRVTRYSNGSFAAQTEANDVYSEFVVEGFANDGLGPNGSIFIQRFKWVPDAEQFDLVAVAYSADVTPNFGPNEPIRVPQT